MKVQINHLGLIISVNAMQPRKDCDTLDIELSQEVLNNLSHYLVRDGKVVLNDEIAQNNKCEARKLTAKQYLKATDFYLARKVETGKAVPNEVLSKRAKARALLTTQLPDFE